MKKNGEDDQVHIGFANMIDEDQWTYDNTMSQEVDMDYENEQEYGVNEPPHFDCSEAFNTSQVFGTRDDVLLWARSVALENEFVAIITRDIGSRKCGCSFKLRGKLVHGGKGWMVKLICGIHNHELAKTLVGHPYVGQLTKDEKNIIADITKSMVKPRNILLTLKEHNANSCTTIKQICNARSAYRSSIRGTDTEMQHLMKLLERDQYIHWHKLKDEVVVCDLFWCHPDAMKLNNACHLVFFIDSTYKTNRYKLPLLDFVGMTPTGMTFFARFAYMEGEHQGLCEAEVTIKEEIETICKRFKELDAGGKVTLKSKLQEIAYPDQNSMCPPLSKSSNSLVKHSASSSDPQKPPNPTRIISMLDQFELFIQGFSHDIVDVKADGMGEDSWSLVRNKLIKELGKWSHDYINLFGGTERFEELRLSLLVDGFSKVSVDKWMDITEMGYVISSRYNVYLTDHCPLPPLALLWSRNCQPRAK
ncbi:Protein FAR1-RELATED SEQUENCE 5 [Glycine max]|nr:Protein FAR1-RELATED SEQUENCE 5 [Glycine max]